MRDLPGTLAEAAVRKERPADDESLDTFVCMQARQFIERSRRFEGAERAREKRKRIRDGEANPLSPIVDTDDSAVSHTGSIDAV
jgi:hypothetical protein